MKLISSFIFLFCLQTFAEPTKESYLAKASDVSGNLVYQEKHEISFTADGKVDEAKTSYLKPDGELIGSLVSNFQKQITAPEHTFRDLRTGFSYGLEIKDDNFVLWKQEKDQPREEKVFKKKDFPNDALVVGCQGLHYYLIDNLDSVKEKKNIAIKYLIPGKLDYYSFTLNFRKEDDEFLYLRLHIDNFFLRLFTDALDLKYRKKDRRLMAYSGLSNIPNEKGQLQYVDIDYTYTP